MKPSRCLFLLLLLAAGVLSPAIAESVIARPVSATLDPAGGELELEVQIIYEQAPGAVGLELALPSGWRFVGCKGAEAPAISSARGATGKVECAWTTVPRGGVEFGLVLAYPAGAGAETLTGTAQLRRDGKRLDLKLTVPLSP